MIRADTRVLPNEELNSWLKRMNDICDWCEDNLKDYEWDVYDKHDVSAKNSSLWLFAYFEFLKKEHVTLIALKFGL